MNDRNRSSLWAAILGSLILVACASTPFDLEQRPLSDWSPVQALHDPAARGERAMWGGEIVGVDNRAEQTLVEVIALPLGRQGQPLTDEQPGARFVFSAPGFLEPVVYAPGRYITVVGIIDGQQRLPAGATIILAPRLQAEDWHLWPRDQQRWRSNVQVGFGFGVRF